VQACLIKDTAPSKGNNGEIQDVHMDAVFLHSPTGDKGAEGLQHCNAERALQGKVNSWFFPFQNDYALAFYPRMHKLAGNCLQYFSDNYPELCRKFKEQDPECNESEIRTRFLDNIVHYLESNDSDLEAQSYSAVFGRFEAGDIIRINSILPHFGLPLHEIENNIRGFLFTSQSVIQVVFFHKLQTFDHCFEQNEPYFHIHDSTDTIADSLVFGALCKFMKPLRLLPRRKQAAVCHRQ
jgi:hypothetical protein